MHDSQWQHKTHNRIIKWHAYNMFASDELKEKHIK